MEGQSIVSNKLKFLESRRKFRVASDNDNSSANHKLIAAANNHGLVLFGSSDKTVKAVSTHQILDFSQSKDKAEILNLNQFTFSNQLTFRPSLLTVARYGYSSVLFVSGRNEMLNCPEIDVIDLDTRTSIGQLSLNQFAGAEIIDYAWHPNYYESIIALCTSRGQLLVVAIDKRAKGVSLAYSNEQYGVLTCCWSPKGKNLAIGMFNGKILRLEPVVAENSFTFKEVEKSTLTFSNPKITMLHQVIKLRWVNKTFLLCVHANLANQNGPDTVYSVITVKPSKPYRYWSSVCFENQILPNYTVHPVNLTNAIICTTNTSGEAGVIGVDGAKEAKTNELNDWNTIIIDEEGARIELPLDANNRETYSRGATLAFLNNNIRPDLVDRPIMILYSSDGVLCPYAAMHSESILKLPEFQQPLDCPIKVESKQVAPPQSSVFGSGMISGQALNFATLAGSPSTNVFGSPSSLTQHLTSPSIGSISTMNAFGSPASLTQHLPTSTANPTSPISTFGSPASLTQHLPPTTANPASSISTFGSPASLTQHLPTPTTNPAPSISAFGSPLSLAQHLPVPRASAPVISAFGSSVPASGLATTNTFGGLSSFAQHLPASPAAPSNISTFGSSSSPAQNLQTPPASSKPENVTSSPVGAPPTSTAFSSQSSPAQQFPAAQVNVKPASTKFDSPSLPAQNQLTEVRGVKQRVGEQLSMFPKEIAEIKKGIEFNEVFLGMLDEINHLRTKFSEVHDIHNLHREALDAVRADIDALDLGNLENLCIIEYIKSRSKGTSRKKSIDPVTLKKVEGIKQKVRLISEKLKDLNDNVDVSWEDFIRRKNASDNKDRRLNSLDLIYKALATNQKIITVFKRKVNAQTSPTLAKSNAGGAMTPTKSSINTSGNCDASILLDVRRGLNPGKLKALREFLSSRGTVPARRPETIRHTSRKLLQSN